MKKILCLLSGGLDSTVVTTMAVDEVGAENVGVCFVNYGQRHMKEVEAFQEVAKALKIEANRWHILDLTHTFKAAKHKTTLLAGSPPVPVMTYKEMSERQGPAPTYVPLRNPMILTAASVIAMSQDYDEVWAGMHAEDARNDAYPDCRMDCFGALSSAIWIGSYSKVRLRAPLGEMVKSEVVKKGMDLGAPLEKTWSCYVGGKKHCGKCATCVARKKAFEDAGFKDPTTYEG